MLDLFSGIGGITIAAEWAGIETVAFCEIEKYPQRVLRKRFPDVPIFEDVRSLDKKLLFDAGIKDIDIIAGGYPCQPFSMAGKRRGESDERYLWDEVRRLIREIRPTYFIGENVAGHVTLGLDKVLGDLEDEGYSTRTFLISASAVGAWHKRERVFIVAYSGGKRSNSKEKCNTDGDWTETMQEWKESFVRFSDISKDVSDSNGKRLEMCKDSRIISESRKKTVELITGCYPGGEYWSTEPELGRVANGISHRVDRLRCLGNAVVPQQIYPIFKCLVELNKYIKI